LTNVGSEPLLLAATFVGARDEAGDHRDSEQLNLDRTLAAGETVATQGRVEVDSAGRWCLWPCYELGDGTNCPDEWQAFPVVVGSRRARRGSPPCGDGVIVNRVP